VNEESHQDQGMDRSRSQVGRVGGRERQLDGRRVESGVG